MTPKTAEYTIEMTAEECYDMAYYIFRALTYSVEKHWVKHLNVDWKDRESASITRMKMFFELGLYPSLFDSYMSQLSKTIEDAKANKATSQNL